MINIDMSDTPVWLGLKPGGKPPEDFESEMIIDAGAGLNAETRISIVTEYVDLPNPVVPGELQHLAHGLCAVATAVLHGIRVPAPRWGLGVREVLRELEAEVGVLEDAGALAMAPEALKIEMGGQVRALRMAITRLRALLWDAPVTRDDDDVDEVDGE